VWDEWFGPVTRQFEWTLLCAECGRPSDALARGWRGYRTDLEEDGDLPELAFFCVSCAELEFGEE
jgi:hypothetical protein